MRILFKYVCVCCHVRLSSHIYYRSNLPPGVTQIYIEIYDECSFVMDELIAWGHIEIPPQVIQKGETHEDWYMLSGKQGDNQEGMINLVFSYTVKTIIALLSSMLHLYH